MKHVKKVFALIALFVVTFLVILYAYFEPQSAVGNTYLKSKYEPSVKNLSNISEHLQVTNGGYLPNSFDAYLFSRLMDAEVDSKEYRNIIGFYACQALASRSGSLMFSEKGREFLPSIVRYGREEVSEVNQKGYLFPAYGVARGREVYKGWLPKAQLCQASFDLVESGELGEIHIEEP